MDLLVQSNHQNNINNYELNPKFMKSLKNTKISNFSILGPIQVTSSPFLTKFYRLNLNAI